MSDISAEAANLRRPKATARGNVKRVHKVFSLAAAAFWFVQALTGVLIVFHWEMDDSLVNGADKPVDVAALSRRIETLPVETGPGWRFGSLWVSAGTPGRFDIALENESSGEDRSIRVAGDGTVLRNRSSADAWRNGGWIGKLVLIHHNLLGGTTGSWIVGLSGILLLTNILLGLKLAWPKARGWAKALRPPPAKAGPARTYGWHRAVGLWLAGPALITLGCGTLLVFEHGVGEALGAQSLSAEAPPSSAPLRLRPEAAIRTAMIRFPGASLVALYPPSEEAPFYDVRLLQANEIRRAYGKTQVLVDARSGAVLAAHDPAQAAPARAFMDSLFPVHTGEALGLGGRLMVMLIGIGLMTMIVLGTRLWWLRRR